MLTSFIASLALRAGLPNWMVQAILALLLAAVLFGSLAGLHHHVYHQGEVAADARNAKVNKANSDRANAERDKLNKQIAAVQAELDAARATVAAIKKEMDDEKAVSTERQRRLVAGDERMRILTRQRPAGPEQPPASGCAGGLDPQASVEADIDPAVAGWLEGFRLEHNEAIRRLDACILRYDAVKAAADAMP